MAATIDLSKYPQELRDYIEKRQRRYSARYETAGIPVPPNELASIVRECIDWWQRGRELIATMSEDEHARCQELFRQRVQNPAEFSGDKLIVTYFDDGVYLIPAYIACLKDARST